MKNNTVLLPVLIMMLVMYTPGFCNESAELVETMGQGSVNWGTGIIRAQGRGLPPEWAHGKPQEHPLALTKARMVAYKNLLKVVQNIRVNSKTTIKEAVAKDAEMAAQLDSMIRNAEVAKEEYRLNGTVDVIIQMSMTGGFAQLILPDNILHVEPVKTIGSIKKSGVPGDQPAPEPFTGFVVDARGLSVQPVLALNILNENGKEVYGPAYVSREHAVQQGMCVYLKDIERALEIKRVGKHPLVVKGIKTQGPENSDIIISNADAAILKSKPYNLSFLRKCHVAVIVD